MPVRPEERGRYPANWREISNRIRFQRAKGRCECSGECGQDHGGRCEARHGLPHPSNGKTTVMTTAHLNHQPEDCSDENLAAFCAPCHLRYDRDHHAETRKATRERKLEAERERVRSTAGQMQFAIECATGKPFAR